MARKRTKAQRREELAAAAYSQMPEVGLLGSFEEAKRLNAGRRPVELAYKIADAVARLFDNIPRMR